MPDPAPCLLSHLFEGFLPVPKDQDCTITGMTIDSRQVTPGNLFIAYQGTHSDGHAFIEAAAERGAAAILMSEHGTSPAGLSIPVFACADPQQWIGPLASRFYGDPSASLWVAGVTGTNGKTSIAHTIAAGLSENQVPCGFLGTVGAGFPGELALSDRTTPDAVGLQAQLRGFLDGAATAAALEISSHGLHQGRVNALKVDCAIFSNLTRDHLDYHGTMEAYGAAKRQLFEMPGLQHAIINWDDAFGKTLIQDFASTLPVIAYSLAGEALEAASDLPSGVRKVFVKRLEHTHEGFTGELVTPWGGAPCQIPLWGRHNVSNALAFVAALGVYGLPLQNILASLGHIQGVPGRMERISGSKGPTVVVDYAHTPDALEQLLTAVRPHCGGKIRCIFGCGGDRDPGKRPLMAQLAESLSDVVVVTDDNPRSESSENIIKDVCSGFSNGHAHRIIPNREQAILETLSESTPQDVVVVAGKGHESYQDIQGKKIFFSDAAVVTRWFNETED